MSTTKGNSLIRSRDLEGRSIVVHPRVDTVSPSQGSLVGGTVLTIEVRAFPIFETFLFFEVPTVKTLQLVR